MSQDSKQDEVQKKFEERYGLFMDDLSGACEDQKVETAIAIVADPETPDALIVFQMGNPYDQAIVLAKLLRAIKSEIEKNTSV